MASVLPTSSDEDIELVRAGHAKYWKEASDLTLRNRYEFALMEKYGVIETNADMGFAGVWTATYRNADVSVFGDNADITFGDQRYLQQFTVDLRGYKATDRLSKKQRIMNSRQQIVNLYDKKSKELLKGMRNNFCSEFYNDGYTGNSNRFIGIESFMGDDGATVAADKVARPSDTYGGQSTVLGTLGGSWSSNMSTSPNATIANDWPYGQGEAEYDWNSPLLVNTTSTSWDEGATFDANAAEVLRWAMIAQRHRTGKTRNDSSAPVVQLLSADMYGDFLRYFDARNQQWVPVQEAIDLGFPDVVNFEGSHIAQSYDVDAGEGYMLCPDMMEFFTPQSQLFESEGPYWSMPDQAYLYIVTGYGNYRWSPKFFGHYEAYA